MAARQFGASLLASRWSQITDSTTKNMNFQALFEVQEMCLFFFFFFFYGRFAIHRTSLYSIRFNASVSYLTTRMIDCSLNRQSFCMNYAIFWAKLEVMVITLEPRTSNIAGSSCKYTNGFFSCFYIRSTALSLLDMSQVGVIVFWIFIEDPYIFWYRSLAINDAMRTRTVNDKCRLQCAAWKCYKSARAYGVIIFM